MLKKKQSKKTPEATSDFIGNKIRSLSKKSTKKLENDNSNNEIEAPRKRYISPEKREQIIEELRLV